MRRAISGRGRRRGCCGCGGRCSRRRGSRRRSSGSRTRAGGGRACRRSRRGRGAGRWRWGWRSSRVAARSAWCRAGRWGCRSRRSRWCGSRRGRGAGGHAGLALVIWRRSAGQRWRRAGARRRLAGPRVGRGRFSVRLGPRGQRVRPTRCDPGGRGDDRLAVRRRAGGTAGGRHVRRALPDRADGRARGDGDGVPGARRDGRGRGRAEDPRRGGDGGKDQLEWFRREVRLARRITHPNVARTHDMGEQNGAHYITMEFVEGTTLQELLRVRDGEGEGAAGRPAQAAGAGRRAGGPHRAGRSARGWRRRTRRGWCTAT
jgi:hypothetical protein